MLLSPLLSFLVEPFEIRVQLVPVHSPHAATAQLDRWESPRTNKCVHLRNADAQVVRHIFERQISRLESGLCLLGALGRALRWGHLPKIAPSGDRYLDLVSFAPVWSGD